MIVRVVSAEAEGFTHRIELPDLPAWLSSHGMWLRRVARGSSSEPAILAVLRREEILDDQFDVPVNIEIVQDSSHPNLNRRVVFRGLRDAIERRFGVRRIETTESGRGTEIALRVYIEPAADDDKVAKGAFGPDVARHPTVWTQIQVRRGQPAFRRALRQQFEDRCVISGCTIVDLLEAAHIEPFAVDANQSPDNGLLLRSDLHTLFDLNLIGIHPDTGRVAVHLVALHPPYVQLVDVPVWTNGVKLSQRALRARWEQFIARSEGHGG